MSAGITSIDSPDEFCLALKEARERSGITLEDIAAATKIPAYLFDALEHNDLRRWPNGLFRRSFFRDYVRAIGVPVSEACAQFARLFPDETAELKPASEAVTPAVPEESSPLARLSAALIDAITNAFSSTEPPADAVPTKDREWVSDARRVGPSSGLRVRIKLPK
jgi:cytoskeletal protein RodZ